MKIFEDLYQENRRKMENFSEDKKNSFNNFLSFIDKNYNWDNLEQIACSNCYIEDLANKNDGELKVIANDYRKYIKNNKDRIAEEKAKIKKIDLSKFNVSGAWEVLMFAIVYMYLGCVATNNFLVNNFIDTIVATVAMAVGVRSVVWRYRIGKRNNFPNKIFIFELFTILLCFVMKLISGTIIDLSVVFLIAMFYFTKINAKKAMDIQ